MRTATAKTVLPTDKWAVRRQTDNETQGLAAVGDWHYGSHTARPDAILKWIQAIKDNGWWWVSLADLCENATRSSLGAIFEQTRDPDQQIDDIVEMLLPIKDQCLGMVAGNHGQRSLRDAGIDHDKRICRQLGVEYVGATFYGLFEIGETTWRVMAHHTTGGGTLLSSKLRPIEKMGGNAPEQDLYIGGHGHADVAASDDIDVTEKDGRIVTVRRQYSSCGSLLSYRGSYAEYKMYRPASCCQTMHILGQDSPTGKKYQRYVEYF